MSNITIHLEPETKQSLLRKANEGGQTLETYLEEMIQRHLHGPGASANAGLETDEEEIVDRPWRGVFVAARPRQPLFPHDLTLTPDQTPKTAPRLNMNWHRPESDNE